MKRAAALLGRRVGSGAPVPPPADWSGVKAIHQFTPTLEHSAVGLHILRAQEVLRALGIVSEIYASEARRGLETKARPHTEYNGALRRGEVILYHVAIGSVVGDFVGARPEPVLLDHHNITPAEIVSPWEPGIAYGIHWGRRQLAQLAQRCELGVADSAYNESELTALGVGRTAVAPILVDFSRFDVEPDPDTLSRLGEAKAGGGADLLFVSSLMPHKAQHDLIKALAVYRRVYDPKARLHLIGGAGSPRYLEALRSLAVSLDVADAVDITGGVSEEALAAYYEAGDLFVCLSDHEGFAVPVLEAMHHGVPVVAYATTAVPGTVGDGGLLLADKAPTTVAAAIDRVLRDDELRRALAAAGAARVEDFRPERVRAEFVAALSRLFGPLP